MRWTTLAVVAAMAVPAWAGSLSVGSGVQWYVASFPDLSGYIQQANETIRFVNDMGDVDGHVVPIDILRGGPGIVVSQSLGYPVGMGAQLLMLKGGVSTEGSWTRDGVEHDVELSLEIGLVAGLAQATLAFVGGLLEVSLAAGWGVAWLDHRCEFNLPAGGAIPFAPLPDESQYRTNGFVGQLGVRAMLPLRPGVALGTEGGLRFAPLGVPRADGEALDLSGDGVRDELSFSGVWVGLTVTLIFEL